MKTSCSFLRCPHGCPRLSPTPFQDAVHIFEPHRPHLDDDDDESEGQYNSLRYAKRPRMADPPGQSSSCIPSHGSNEQHNVALRRGATNVHAATEPNAPRPCYRRSSQSHRFSRFSNFVPQPAQASYRPAFAGPPQFTAYRNHQPITPSPPARSPPYQNSSQPSQPSSQPSQSYPNGLSVARSTSYRPHSLAIPTATDTSVAHGLAAASLPPELPPKTPVCIGSLTVTALVLYPVPYLMPQNAADPEWAYVRLQYEHRADKVSGKGGLSISRRRLGGVKMGESVSGDVFGGRGTEGC